MFNSGESIFGSGYNLFAFINATLNFIKGITSGLLFLNNELGILQNIVDMIPEEYLVSILILIFVGDIFKYSTGISYLNSFLI